MCIHCNDHVEHLMFGRWFSLSTIRRGTRLYGWEPACTSYRARIQQYYSNMEKAWQRGIPNKDKSTVSVSRSWHLFPDLVESGMYECLLAVASAQSSIAWDARVGWNHRHRNNRESPVTGAGTTQTRVSPID